MAKELELSLGEGGNHVLMTGRRVPMGCLLVAVVVVVAIVGAVVAERKLEGIKNNT